MTICKALLATCTTALCGLGVLMGVLVGVLVSEAVSDGQTLAHHERASIAERAAPVSDPQNRAGWTLYEPLSDEFNGPQLNPEKWHTGIAGWPGRPPALFAGHNIALADGALRITLRKESIGQAFAAQGFHDYTTGALQSAVSVLYGYFEVRARAMKSAGSSGIWLAHKDDQDWGEIDVAEMGGNAPANPRRVFMSTHVFEQDGAEKRAKDIAAVTLKANVADGFHVYGLQWTEQSLDFYVDGELRRHVENTSWHSPATLILDAETQGAWWGMPRDSDLPSVFSVDYVRAWKPGAR